MMGSDLRQAKVTDLNNTKYGLNNTLGLYTYILIGVIE